MANKPLASIDLNLLLVLEALVSEESVAAAARKVSLSPSAVSHALARLRELTGDPVLVRVGRRMSSTPRARRLLPHLTAGLAELERALEMEGDFDPAKEERMVRIAAVDFVQNALMGPLLAWLREQAPKVDLAVQPFGASALHDLATGESDLAFAAHKKSRGFHSRVVLEEPFVCLLRRGHPALRQKLTPSRYAALDHVLISPRGRTPGAVDRALKKRGLSRRVALAVPNFLAAALVVSQSDLVVTCGERLAKAVASALALTIVSPPVSLPPFEVGMFWHERQEHDPFLGWLRRSVVELLAR